MSDDALRDDLMKGLRQFATCAVDDEIANRLLECITCAEADSSDPSSFDRLEERLEKLEGGQHPPQSVLFGDTA